MTMTVDEAVQEYNGLSNEAEALLDSLSKSEETDVEVGTILFQAINLAAIALATVQAHERRISYALEALRGPLDAPAEETETDTTEETE